MRAREGSRAQESLLLEDPKNLGLPQRGCLPCQEEEEDCGDLAAVAKDEGRDPVVIATTVGRRKPKDKELYVILPSGLADPLSIELLEL